jgi:septal ring factor EnvC (AmiA/AmiB activator)
LHNRKKGIFLIGGIFAMTNEQFQNVILKEFKELRKEMNQRFDAIDQRLDRVESRLDGVEQRLDGVEQRLDSVEHKVANIFEQLSIIQVLGEHEISIRTLQRRPV